jgi:hypothetical protein
MKIKIDFEHPPVEGCYPDADVVEVQIPSDTPGGVVVRLFEKLLVVGGYPPGMIKAAYEDIEEDEIND